MIFASHIPTIDLKNYFDVLNLQSDNGANFTTISGNVSQWNDLSPSANHATQTTAGSRPSYNSGEILFSGSSFLNLTSQISRTTYSIYLVIKNTSSASSDRVAIGGNSGNYMDHQGTATSNAPGSPNSLWWINNGGGDTWSFNEYGEGGYQIISIRRTNATIVVKCNGRVLRSNSTTGTRLSNSLISFIGKTGGGFNWVGVIRAVGVSSSNVSDAVDNNIIYALGYKYSIPSRVPQFITGFGDSITVGTGATTVANTWLSRLGATKSLSIKRFGISGTPLSNVSGAINNGEDRFRTEVIEKPYSDILCIYYGTNDVLLGYSSSAYQTSVNNVLQGFIDAGYKPSNIYVAGPGYQIGDANGTTVQTFNTVVSNACIAKGTVYVDLYTPMKAAGDGIMSGSVHPNDTGYLLIANTFAALIP